MKNSERIKVLPEPYRTDIANLLGDRLYNNSIRLTSSIYEAARIRSRIKNNVFDDISYIILVYSAYNRQDEINKISE